MSLFDRATTTAMRDRTRSRNYSPERDEFRRDHERRRYWGLQRRHAEKLRRLHGGPTPPTAPPDQPLPTPAPPPAVPTAAAAPTSPPAFPAAAAVPTPTPPVPAAVAVSAPPAASPDPPARTPQPARPSVNAPPVAATATAPKLIQPPHDNRRHSTPPVPRGQQFNSENHSGHETYAMSSITRNFTHPQKARAPPTSALSPRRAQPFPVPDPPRKFRTNA